MSNAEQGQQPGLRSYIVFDSLPDGMKAHWVACDLNEPHLRAGEVAVIDPADLMPMHGELFLIQFQSGDQPRLIETFHWRRPGIWGVAQVRPAPLFSLAGTVVGEPIRWGDVGYTTEHLTSLIVGRVVGILGAPPQLSRHQPM